MKRETECGWIVFTANGKKRAPAICVPLTGKTEAEVLAQLEVVLAEAPDIIEWRADFLTDLANVAGVLALIDKIKATTEIPLLFTIRGEHEGGEAIALSESEKVRLLHEVISKTSVDYVDYEASNEAQFVAGLQDAAREHGKKLILSYHNFNETPDNENLIQTGTHAAKLGADVVKLAVMPKSQEDVLRLLEVTRRLDQTLDVPVITMSMGELGALSRVIGWAYGSVLTFAVGVEASAPGQIPLGDLRRAVEAVQTVVPDWK